MSLVLGYASTRECILMSDGLAVVGNEVQGYERIDENLNKTRKLNERVIIGSTGNVDLRNQLLDFCFPENDFVLLQSITVELATQLILQSMPNIQHLKERVNFLIAGINANGKIQMNSIDDEGIICNHAPEDNDVFITTLSPPLVNAYSIFHHNILNMQNIPIINIMGQTIADVAKLDLTVNANVFVQHIHL